MANEAHIVHFESIMLLKTNLAVQEQSCHFIVISNMQNSVYEKTGETSLIWQSDFSGAFVAICCFYMSQSSISVGDSTLLFNKQNKISKLATFVTLSVSNEYLLCYLVM